MDKRTAGIIGIIISVLLCALPGLAGLCIGPLGIIGALQPDYDAETVAPGIMIGVFAGMICVSVVFIAIPIVIGFLTLRGEQTPPTSLDEPIPEDDF